MCTWRGAGSRHAGTLQHRTRVPLRCPATAAALALTETQFLRRKHALCVRVCEYVRAVTVEVGAGPQLHSAT